MAIRRLCDFCGPNEKVIVNVTPIIIHKGQVDVNGNRVDVIVHVDRVHISESIDLCRSCMDLLKAKTRISEVPRYV